MSASDAPVQRDTEKPVCPICHGVGYVRLNVPIGHPQFGKAVPCACTRQRIQEKRLVSLRKASNLQHLHKMTFDSFQAGPPDESEIFQSLNDALNTAREFAAHPVGWIIFTGAYGSGKTHLAASIANYRVEHGLAVLFVVVPDLLDYLRAAYAPNSEVGYDERFEQVRNIEVLILDDLGTQNATPWAAEKLYQLLNYRYNAELPTVITTNQALDDMDPRLGSRLMDRTLVRKVPIYGRDFRMLAGKDESFGSLNLYAAMTFETFSDRRNELDEAKSAPFRRIIRTVTDYAENPSSWLLIKGGYGVGKTHLAAAVANRVARRGKSVLFVVVPDLLDHLRATFQPGSSVSYDRRFSEVRRAWLLVLDDIGTQSATPWAQEKLFQILNHRYQAGLPTIITASREGWERLDERLKSRFQDANVCTIVDIPVESYHGKPAEGSRTRRTSRVRE